MRVVRLPPVVHGEGGAHRHRRLIGGGAGVHPLHLHLPPPPVVAGADGVGQVEAARRERCAVPLPPDDLLHRPRLVLDEQPEVFPDAPDGGVGAQAQVARRQRRRGMARPEGGESLQRFRQGEGQVGQGEVGGDGQRLRHTARLVAAHLPHGAGEGPPEVGDALRRDGQSGGHRVAAEAHQEVALGSDGGVDVAAGDGAGRAAPHLTLRRGDEDRRAVVPLRQTPGDDADDSRRPGGMAQHQGGVVEQGRVLLDLGDGGLGHLVAEQFAPRVQPLHRRRQGAGLGEVGGQEELDSGGGVVEAAQGVETRRQQVGDVLLGQTFRHQAGQFHHHPQPQPVGPAQNLQSALEEVAGVAGQDGDVGHDADGDQVEQAFRLFGPPGPLVEERGQLVGHADARQLPQRMVGGEHFGVDGGQRRGERLRQVVMVGDEHVHALGDGVGQGLVGGDAGVAGQQQVYPAGEQVFEHRQVDAVRLPAAVGDVVADGRAQGPQGGEEHGGRGLSVGVEIAPDADGLPAADGLLDALRRPQEAGEVGRRGGTVETRVEESAGLGRVGDAAPGQRLGYQRMPADGLSQGGGDRGLLGFEPSLHRFHRANSVERCRNL